MKVYIGGYRNHWISPYIILEKVFFWREIDYNEPIIDKWADRLKPLCEAWQKFLDFVHPEINFVKIDRYDTWSMDYTLAKIVLPMLKQLKETKHGSPNTDDEDVPEHLRSINSKKENEYDTDENHFARWDWVLDEMIWAFEQNVNHNSEDQFFDHSDVDIKAGISEQIGKIKIDKVGLHAHSDRKANGFRLFGKYYQGLWD